jgi:flagellin-like protein
MKLPLPQDSEERGQVGIGVLIIFIALVLVAAVAAGVLINTSGMLQSQAEDTGADAQAQVSNQIQVVSATGVVASDDSGVEDVQLVVKKSAGSEPLDLSQATIQYTSDTASATLVDANGTGSASATEFLVGTTDDPTTEATDKVLENGEKLVITVSGDSLESPNVAAGEEVELQIVDQSGASTIYGVNVPDVLSGKDYVRV